jgi:hypothetical protein
MAIPRILWNDRGTQKIIANCGYPMAIPWLPWNIRGTSVKHKKLSQIETAPDRRKNPAQIVAECKTRGETLTGEQNRRH